MLFLTFYYCLKIQCIFFKKFQSKPDKVNTQAMKDSIDIDIISEKKNFLCAWSVDGSKVSAGLFYILL